MHEIPLRASFQSFLRSVIPPPTAALYDFVISLLIYNKLDTVLISAACDLQKRILEGLRGARDKKLRVHLKLKKRNDVGQNGNTVVELFQQLIQTFGGFFILL